MNESLKAAVSDVIDNAAMRCEGAIAGVVKKSLDGVRESINDAIDQHGAGLFDQNPTYGFVRWDYAEALRLEYSEALAAKNTFIADFFYFREDQKPSTMSDAARLQWAHNSASWFLKVKSNQAYLHERNRAGQMEATTAFLTSANPQFPNVATFNNIAEAREHMDAFVKRVLELSAEDTIGFPNKPTE